MQDENMRKKKDLHNVRQRRDTQIKKKKNTDIHQYLLSDYCVPDVKKLPAVERNETEKHV